MNTKDNARKRESQRRIREALIAELDERGELERVTVTALCKRACVNRSTFYASYHDVFDLAEKTCEEISEGMLELFRQNAPSKQGADGTNHLAILRHIRANQETFRLGFKLGIGDGPLMRWDSGQATFQPLDERGASSRQARYQSEFFRAGFNAIVRLWLEGGCRETPEEIYEVIPKK